MTAQKRWPLLAGVGWLAAMLLTAAETPGQPLTPAQRAEYAQTIQKTAAMVQDPIAQRLAAAKGLQVMNITWEDTGRFKGSAVGPNISDMTIQIQQGNDRKGFTLTCMPVIRYPNFEDKTADLKIEKFTVLVGNERGAKLEPIPLAQYLGNIRRYLSKPESWKGDRTQLLAKRDTHVLVSAQACFLPVPKQGIAEFNPVLFNYQSRKDDPAVLAILVTPQGTSATVIDNQRDGFRTNGVWGQRLFFNKNGQRCSLTGQRKSDVQAKGPAQQDPNAPKLDVAGEQGVNMVMLIQVPLKQKELPRLKNLAAAEAAFGLGAVPKADSAPGSAQLRRSDVEEAVIGFGEVEGPFTEIDNLPIERDERFPIRVTVQFYKATSNGIVNEKDIADIAEQIDRVYREADYVGSLVLGTGAANRPTEHDGPQFQPPNWWADFWQRYAEEHNGYGRAEIIQHIRSRRGQQWFPLTETDLLNEAKQIDFHALPRPSGVPANNSPATAPRNNSPAPQSEPAPPAEPAPPTQPAAPMLSESPTQPTTLLLMLGVGGGLGVFYLGWRLLAR